jgi:hypothetical protein
MLTPIDQYFLQKEEPIKGCLLFLRKHILDFHNEITEVWNALLLLPGKNVLLCVGSQKI